jgi:GNAT superfamily N-acetyltransferase
MSRGDGFALVVEIDGRPAGFAGYHHTARFNADAELESIYLLKAAQRQGVGSRLLRTIAGRLLADGSRSMCVGYDPRNPYQSFYRKHGALAINPHWAIWPDLRPLATISLTR